MSRRSTQNRLKEQIAALLAIETRARRAEVCRCGHTRRNHEPMTCAPPGNYCRWRGEFAFISTKCSCEQFEIAEQE